MGQKLMIFCFFFLIGSTFLRADNAEVREEKKNYSLSRKYRRGHYFIYDCYDKHFACVDKDSFERCGEDRKLAFSLRKDILPCTPLKRFETFNECKMTHYVKIHQSRSKEFCLNRNSLF